MSLATQGECLCGIDDADSIRLKLRLQTIGE
jgi:hypothetical protein